MNAAFAWPGGKRALVPTLLKLLPAPETYATYVEVFAGSAKLLFAKDPSRREVMNDLNGDITNFFRVAKHRAAELAERFELECIHAGRFRDLHAEAPAECEVDRALRFAYLTWYSFGSKGEHFASSNAKAKSQRRSIATIRATLTRTAERLASVQIEQRDFADMLTRYDAPDTVFYMDPPYVEYQSNGRYPPLDAERRTEMFRAIGKLKGKCLVSFDDRPEIRAHVARHRLQSRKVTVKYTLAGGHQEKNAGELLIANYKLAA